MLGCIDGLGPMTSTSRILAIALVVHYACRFLFSTLWYLNSRKVEVMALVVT